MNHTAAVGVSHAHYYYYHYTSTGSSGSNGTGGMIAGVVIACIGGVIILSVIIFLIVRCCQQSQQQQAADQVQVTYPQPTPAYNEGDGMQPMMGGGGGGGVYGGGGGAMVPPSGPQPAITPLGVPNGTNPFAPNTGGSYVYGMPLGVPPPQYADDYGNGMYYNRAMEAPPLQRTNSNFSTKSGTAVTYLNK